MSAKRVLACVLAAVLACAPDAARARPPVAQVWVDGHDIDGPPPGPTRVPGSIAASLWLAPVSTKLRTKVTPAAAETTSGLADTTPIAASLYGHFGYYLLQLDAFQQDQNLTDPYTLSGTTYAKGMKFTQQNIVIRGSRELGRYRTPWAHYHLDAGLRLTQSSLTFNNAGVSAGRATGYISPELTLHGVHAFDDSFGFHTRTSLAINGATTAREVAIEFAASFNYHLFRTEQGEHDASVGIRYLSSKLAFTDPNTAQETTVDSSYLGPEFTYAIRW